MENGPGGPLGTLGLARARHGADEPGHALCHEHGVACLGRAVPDMCHALVGLFFFLNKSLFNRYGGFLHFFFGIEPPTAIFIVVGMILAICFTNFFPTDQNCC